MLVWVTLNVLPRFFDNATATSTDMRIVSMITTKIASTTAAITLPGAPPPPTLSSSTSPGVESVEGVLSSEVEESGIILLVVDEAMSVAMESLDMASSVVGSGDVSALVVGPSVVGSGVVGSSVVGRAVVGSSITIVVGGSVKGHGGGVGNIRGQSDVPEVENKINISYDF